MAYSEKTNKQKYKIQNKGFHLMGSYLFSPVFVGILNGAKFDQWISPGQRSQWAWGAAHDCPHHSLRSPINYL